MRIIVLIFIFPLLGFGQSKYKPTKEQLTKTYVQAIGDFIKAVNEMHKSKFDTLFFGKRAYDQPDDFPDITLPESIENVHIRLIKPEVGEKMQKAKPSLVYINLMGWLEKEKAEFIFVIFSNKGEHQYDYYLNYTSRGKANVYKVEKARFEDFKLNDDQ